MSQAGLISLERPDERSDRDRLSAATHSPSSSAQSLVISSNLRAALEYEERIRNAASQGPSGYGSIPASSEWGGGLPPPPRHKSRLKAAAPSSQTSPTGSISLPPSPVGPSRAADGSSGPSANPYINPVPRLSYLIRDEPPLVLNTSEPAADTRSIGQDSSDSQGTSSSRTVDEARMSPTSGSSGKGDGLRHLRGLSSLQKVEKMIGKSKKSLGMIAEGNLKLTSGRRGSDADMQGSGGRAAPGPERRKAASVLYAASAPNSPISA
ncbi:uncharacterized protein C8Q71DRAFT_834736, partial [Rhodofomes roseus]